jgi:hypothetical protein
MPLFACEECGAIYSEMQEAARAVRGRLPDSASYQTLAAWIEKQEGEDHSGMREHSALWKAWRRLQEHRTRTGHWQSVLVLPPGATAGNN